MNLMVKRIIMVWYSTNSWMMREIMMRMRMRMSGDIL